MSAAVSPEKILQFEPRIIGQFAQFCAALAICSDLDETPDADTYFELMRFLNTTENTSMGPGVGLEIGNSIYFDMAPGRFSYWNTSEENREKIRKLVRSGHIDCLHSFGDLATTRAHAARALEELERHDCRLKVWVDHSKAPTNFGSDIMHGHGDDPKHAAYHADLTIAHGIRYIWRGRVTSVIGQARPFSLEGIANWRRPLASARTLAKEAVKQALACSGNAKYRLHRANQLVQSARLRNGCDKTVEFLRCNPHFSGVSCGDTGDGIAEVLTENFLKRLIERKGACILYTHLGKLNGKRQFSEATVQAFRRLAQYQQSGRIAVMTTSRLLGNLFKVDDIAPFSSLSPSSFPKI
ncbi:MAG TPA: hypothetical protein VH595_00610 [Verrucomicrobiae bacterium]|jgi:hypothetical protein|nr:hypothetical protein [Verrucomicrobiae bacterium]